jgi:Flp pilus assembly protein TadD
MINDQIQQLEQTLETVSQTHRTDFIIDTARKILALSPHHEEASLQLILALYNSRQYDVMFETIQSAMTYFAQRPWIHYALYLYYLYQGGSDYIKAKEHIEKAISLNPANPLFYRNLGEIYLINREADKAVVNLSKAVELQPTNPEYRSRLALALLRMHRVNDSLDMANRALRDGADDADVYDSVGMIYTLSGDLDKGEELFRVALRMMPTYEYFQKHIDWVLREKQDREGRQRQRKQYTPLYLRHKGTKLHFDEDKEKTI